MKNPNVIKRIKAFAVDYLIILLYIGFLLTATLLVSKTFAINLRGLSPLSGQLLGFTTLTLPVVLYFTISENSRYAATIGKRKVHLQVVSIKGSKAGFGQLFVRNCTKFLPWEIAHFFVFRLVHFTTEDVQPPMWVFMGLLASQVLALVYLLCLMFAKNNRSLYEWFSRTQVI